MKKIGKHLSEKKESQEINEIIAYMNTYINKTDEEIYKLKNLLLEIKKITENNQYGNSEVGFRIIKEKLRGVK